MADKTRLVMRQRVMTHSLAISSATACADLDIAQSRLLSDICICNYICQARCARFIALGGHVGVGSGRRSRDWMLRAGLPSSAEDASPCCGAAKCHELTFTELRRIEAVDLK